MAVLGLWFQITINNSSRASDTDRAQEGALQAYFDGMTSLVIDGRLGLEGELKGAGVLAKARTVTVLLTLDRNRKNAVLRFLRDGNLVVKRGDENRISKVSLIDAVLRSGDLRGLDLRDINLHGADLTGADLAGAGLSNAGLSNVKFDNANLRNAILTGSDLCGASLINADLRGALLNRAILFNATLQGADLRKADLSGSDMRDALSIDEKENPDLEKLDRNKNTVKVYTERGFLREEAENGCFESSYIVHPHGTILQNADLRGADVGGANITDQQLEHAKFRP